MNYTVNSGWNTLLPQIHHTLSNIPTLSDPP